MLTPAALPVMAALLAPAALSVGSIVDGTIVGDNYGSWLALQAVETGFGNNASELDAAYGVVEGGRLYLALTGNLDDNFNKLEIFIDSVPGGEAVFSGTPGNNGTTVMTGLAFGAGFEPDYYLTARRGFDGTVDKFDLDIAVLGTPAFSSYADVFGGSVEGAGTTGTGPGNALPIEVAYDDSNMGGIIGGSGPVDIFAAAAVTTGFELCIDLADLGSPPGDIRLMAFVNNQGHTFASNQFLPPLAPPQGNLGGDGSGNFTGSLQFDRGDFPGVPFLVVRNNDECFQASEIFEGAIPYSTLTATASGILASGLPPFTGDPYLPVLPNLSCSDSDDLHNDIWFKFTAPANAGYDFSTCSTANHFSKIAVYSGTCAAPVALACNFFDNLCISGSTAYVTGLTAGTEYLVQLGGTSPSEVGSGFLTVTRRGGTQSYCTTSPNSVGPGAVIGSSGQPGSSFNPFRLEVTGLPSEACLFYFGPEKANTPFVAGTLCVRSPARLNPVQIPSGGAVSRAIPDSDLGYPTVGMTLYFQLLYRDSAAGDLANTSDGLAVTFGNLF